MTRPALTGRTRTRRITIPAMPWQRTRVTAVHPVRTELVDVYRNELRALAANPNVASLHPVQGYSDGRMRIRVTYTDRATNVRHPRRWEVTGLRQWALAVALIIGIPSGVAAAIDLVWVLWGAEITAGLRLALSIAAVFLSALAITWLVITKMTRTCPGLHCDGCGGH